MPDRRYATMTVRMEHGRFADGYLGSRFCAAMYIERSKIPHTIFVETDEPGTVVQWVNLGEVEITMSLEFTSRPLTVREYMFMTRYVNDNSDSIALIELALLRLVDQSKKNELLDMPACDLGPSLTLMMEGITAAGAIQQLGSSWDMKPPE